MSSLAEEYFGTDTLQWEGRTVPVVLTPLATATPRFKRGFGVELAGREGQALSTWQLMHRYRDQVNAVFNSFGFLGVLNSVPNPVHSGSTENGSFLMHVDSYHAGVDRKDWEATQLNRDPSIPREDPTHLADAQIFLAALRKEISSYLSQRKPPYKKEVARVLRQMLSFPVNHQLTALSGLIKGKAYSGLFLELERKAYDACQKGTYAFHYTQNGALNRHLVMPASGLTCSWECAHGRLGELTPTASPSSLQNTIYPYYA